MRHIALVVCLTLLAVLPAAAEEACFSRENAPYWHKDENCDFAETEWLKSDRLGEETRRIDVLQAEAEGQKPCPGCATEFAPTFTGNFPDWPHPLAPWGYESGELIDDGDGPRGEFELPADILNTWGAPDAKLQELFPGGESIESEVLYPDDYAGLFINACGGCTVLLVDPSLERVARWQELLEGRFWVLAARYSYNELKALAKQAGGIIEIESERMRQGEPPYYHIVSVSVGCITNDVQIGVTPYGFDEGVQRIREALAGAGYANPGMLRFVPADYPTLL